MGVDRRSGRERETREVTWQTNYIIIDNHQLTEDWEEDQPEEIYLKLSYSMHYLMSTSKLLSNFTFHDFKFS